MNVLDETVFYSANNLLIKIHKYHKYKVGYCYRWTPVEM